MMSDLENIVNNNEFFENTVDVGVFIGRKDARLRDGSTIPHGIGKILHDVFVYLYGAIKVAV